MTAIASQITSLTIVYSSVYSGADQRKHQSSASLAFVRGLHRWPVTGQSPAQMASNAINHLSIYLSIYQSIKFGRNGSGTKHLVFIAGHPSKYWPRSLVLNQPTVPVLQPPLHLSSLLIHSFVLLNGKIRSISHIYGTVTHFPDNNKTVFSNHLVSSRRPLHIITQG